MNLFDLVAGLTLVVSALIGLARGAVVEIATLFAFTAAAAVSVYLLPFTAPIAVESVRPVWAANAAAAAISFIIAYLCLRLLASGVSRALRTQSTLGSIDRVLGLAFGVARALIVLGVVFLVFNAAPNPPTVMTDAWSYPLARGSGLALLSLAPGGLKDMEGFGASLKDRMSGVTPEPPSGAVEAGQDYGAPPAPPDAAPARTLRIEGGALHRRHRRPSDASVE